MFNVLNLQNIIMFAQGQQGFLASHGKMLAFERKLYF